MRASIPFCAFVLSALMVAAPQASASSLEGNYLAKRICTITVPGPKGGEDLANGPPATIQGSYASFHVYLDEVKPSEPDGDEEHITNITAVFLPQEGDKTQVFTGTATFNFPSTDEEGRLDQVIDLDLEQCYAKKGDAILTSDEMILFQGNGDNFVGHGAPFQEVHEEEAWTECNYILVRTMDETINEQLKEYRISLPDGCPIRRPARIEASEEPS